MRAERLRRTKDIEMVRENGEMRTDPNFTLRALPSDRGVVRLAVASPRSVGSAVRRSRARRRVREAFRAAIEERDGVLGADLLVVTRAAALYAPSSELREAVERHLGTIVGQRPRPEAAKLTAERDK